MKGFYKTLLSLALIVFSLSLLASCKPKSEDQDTNTPPPSPQYTINLFFGDGTLPEGFEDSVEVNDDGTVNLPTPSREGYNFLGWYSGDTPITEDFKFTADTSLTAKWEIKKFTVTFLDFYGETIDTQEINWGEAASAPTVPEELDGITFHSWTEDFSSVKADLTVKAHYARKTYTVTFNTAGGSKIASQTVYYDEYPTKPAADPEKTGHTFSGWYLDEGFTVECLFDTAYNGNITIYANMVKDFAEIMTAEDLAAIKDNPDGKYILMNDIDLGEGSWTQIADFSGVLDGNGYRIYNFNVTTSAVNPAFIINNSGTIKNLTLDCFTVTHSADIARTSGIVNIGLLTCTNSGTIKNCTLGSGSFATTTSTYANAETSSIPYTRIGVITATNSGTITSCKIYCDVTINSSCDNSWKKLQYAYHPIFGGVAAYNENTGIIEKILTQNNFTININSTQTDSSSSVSTYTHPRIAGIVSHNDNIISECAMLSNMDINYGGSSVYPYAVLKGVSASGICVDSYATIENCLVGGNINVEVSGHIVAGGTADSVVGFLSGTVKNVYSYTDITIGNSITSNVGGLASHAFKASSVTNSVFSGQLNVGTSVSDYGLILGAASDVAESCYYDSAAVLKVNGSAVTSGTNSVGTAEELSVLQSEEFIFETLGWDSEIWQINEGGHPSLRCFAE